MVRLRLVGFELQGFGFSAKGFGLTVQRFGFGSERLGLRPRLGLCMTGLAAESEFS